MKRFVKSILVGVSSLQIRGVTCALRVIGALRFIFGFLELGGDVYEMVRASMS